MYELPYEFPNDLRLKILGNFRKTSKLAYFPAGEVQNQQVQNQQWKHQNNV